MKKPSKHIYILTALSTTRFNKEFKKKFYRTNQPREKALANIIHCTCFFQHVVNQNRIHARTNMGNISLHKLLLVFCVVSVVLVVLVVK